jgi:hypothetical protein
MYPEGIRVGRPGPPRAVLIAVSRHSVYACAFSEEELQALTDLCRLAEEELADIELTRLLKLNIGIQARVRAVMDATSEGILLIGRDRVMGYHNRRFLDLMMQRNKVTHIHELVKV